VFHVFAVLAEFERDLIRERTAAGLVAARARSCHGGRPSVMTAHKQQVAQEMYRSGQYTVAAIANTLGVSRASVYRHLTRPDRRVGQERAQELAEGWSASERAASWNDGNPSMPAESGSTVELWNWTVHCPQ
jgi:DNA invertase Pin-like site-specific DNA recombinase